MSHYHAVVWLDHNEARVMHISPDDVEKSVIHPAHPHRHLVAGPDLVGGLGGGLAVEAHVALRKQLLQVAAGELRDQFRQSLVQARLVLRGGHRHLAQLGVRLLLGGALRVGLLVRPRQPVACHLPAQRAGR